ncbi:MAG: polysaccharide biosynthesis protein [Chlorobi bacterium]|nr:polysaccharide biosynthesis protein [Chlorobiota bacterium]
MILEKIVSIILKGKHAPRWLILLFDLGISLFSISLAYLLRFNFKIPAEYLPTLTIVIPYVLAIRLISFVLFKSYAGIIRFTTVKDLERIILVVLFGTTLFILGNQMMDYIVLDRNFIPYGILAIDFFIMVFFLSASRLLVKTLYAEIKAPSFQKRNVIVFGAGNEAVITKQAIDKEPAPGFKVIAFIDDREKNIGNYLENIPVYAPVELNTLLEQYPVVKFIFSSIPQNSETRNTIVDTCLSHNIQVLTLPPADKWINGELSINQLRKYKIEDLLGRDPIFINHDSRKQQYLNKRILITGAAGSIGSEIVRQLTALSPEKLILVDQAESPLYYLELEISENLKFSDHIPILADISNEKKMERVIKHHKPDIIFHAAAYKHVPVMEMNPSEAIRTNIQGTKILADLASAEGVQKFIMISTDKAVNPTNVMGASKRIAEMYAQSLNHHSTTRFITTRFGNVLGSNGSVVPRFRKQIESGGPVTITHPEITRFFMTIPEAVSLVLEAGAMGKGGEIFIFDMGKSVKIVDLAKKMINLSGLKLNKDIQIKFTGLRPGEKLYEELLNDNENTLPTYHPKILIAKVSPVDYHKINPEISDLINNSVKTEPGLLKNIMKSLVPEYSPDNSVNTED